MKTLVICQKTVRLAMTTVVFLAAMMWATTTLANNDETTGKAFIEARAQQALDILSDKKLGIQDKKRIFRAYVDETADVERVTSFVLGRYRRQFTDEQFDQFSKLFKEYALNVYESRLSDYKGEKLKVQDAIARRPGDVIVTTIAAGGQLAEPTPVRWRVIKDRSNQWRLVDVEVFGVWLAVTQRQEFVTILNNNGGKPDALITKLRHQTGK